MSSRISALVDLDPLSIPLPHGTEVTLRVERLLPSTDVQGLTQYAREGAAAGVAVRVHGGATHRPIDSHTALATRYPRDPACSFDR